MIDNFDLIAPLLKFESDDDFYHVQILKRKKEHPELGANSFVVKTYFIKSLEELERDMGEMIVLANYHMARVYINLNKRSFEKVAFGTLKKVTEQICHRDYKSVRQSYTSVCGGSSNERENKKWIIDIDDKTFLLGEEVKMFINLLEPIGNYEEKVIGDIPTKNGHHIITKPFRLDAFKQRFPELEVHKDNPTILYIP